MADKTKDLREVLREAHAHFFMLKGEQTFMLKLWEIKEDSIIIDLPKSASMHRTMLGLIPTLDGSAVYEIEGKVESELAPGQMEDTLRLSIDPERVRKVNRRLFPRVNFTPPIDVVIVVEGSDKAVVGSVINMSAGGLRVETSKELPPDRRLTFKFEVECDDEVHVLSPTGMIVYEVPSDAGHAYGVRFGRDEDDTLKEGEEASVDAIERTVDLISLVNKLLVRT